MSPCSLFALNHSVCDLNTHIDTKKYIKGLNKYKKSGEPPMDI